jgi:hypothetical protein
VTRRALEQPNAEAGFELFDCIRCRRGGHAQILRRKAEAPPFRHPGEQAHLVETIHYSLISDSLAEK